MTTTANWSYTAICTLWQRYPDRNEYGDTVGYDFPVTIMCDYQGGLSKRLGDIGAEKVVKNTFWTEFASARTGDYILIGESSEADPRKAGADEIMQVIRNADTFDRLADDYIIITGV
ncbi:hypothetical protein [Erwinia phyllosphaerae]|uniref:hypothetical protein n=1 Tax=Erwinia phyllosphaerae TaxID=2853256 RepID=UPI001FEE89B2|nr:hypothetical protein [Erwinia phyllosphaerae]MBV4366287.1 hypothetical protein [Erwinia phyllosphaerae]